MIPWINWLRLCYQNVQHAFSISLNSHSKFEQKSDKLIKHVKSFRTVPAIKMHKSQNIIIGNSRDNSRKKKFDVKYKQRERECV